MTATRPAAVPLADARRVSHQVWTESSRLLYAGRIDEFLGYWHQDASYEVAYPIPGMPATVQGHDALRAMFGGFGAAAASIEVQNVTFHQTDDPHVAIVEEHMSAVLHEAPTTGTS